MPYLMSESCRSPQGKKEIPSYRIFPWEDPENYIAETNEHLPGDVQEKHARLISAAPDLREALEYFYNIMHDYECSARKGYVKHAFAMARAALAKAKWEVRNDPVPGKPRVSVNVIDWAYHRNGICGAPFHVVLFDDVNDENTRKVGILFDKPFHCVLCSLMSPSSPAGLASRLASPSYRWRRFRGRLLLSHLNFPK